MWVRIKTHGLVPEILVRAEHIIMVAPIIKGGCRVYLDPTVHEVTEFDSVHTMDEFYDSFKKCP
jgi:hypothetical protein